MFVGRAGGGVELPRGMRHAIAKRTAASRFLVEKSGAPHTSDGGIQDRVWSPLDDIGPQLVLLREHAELPRKIRGVDPALARASSSDRAAACWSPIPRRCADRGPPSVSASENMYWLMLPVPLTPIFLPLSLPKSATDFTPASAIALLTLVTSVAAAFFVVAPVEQNDERCAPGDAVEQAGIGRHHAQVELARDQRRHRLLAVDEHPRLDVEPHLLEVALLIGDEEFAARDVGAFTDPEHVRAVRCMQAQRQSEGWPKKAARVGLPTFTFSLVLPNCAARMREYRCSARGINRSVAAALWPCRAGGSREPIGPRQNALANRHNDGDYA